MAQLGRDGGSGGSSALERTVTYFLALHSIDEDGSRLYVNGEAVSGAGRPLDTEACRGSGSSVMHVGHLEGANENTDRFGARLTVKRVRPGSSVVGERGMSVLSCLEQFTDSFEYKDEDPEEADVLLDPRKLPEKAVVRPTLGELLEGLSVPPLIHAVLMEDLEQVNTLLSSMADMSVSEFLTRWTDEDQCTALHYACYVGNEEILRAILTHCKEHLAAAKHFPESSGMPIARRQSVQTGKRRRRLGSIQRIGASIFKSSPSTLSRHQRRRGAGGEEAFLSLASDAEDQIEEDEEEDIPAVAPARSHHLEDPEEVLQSALARVVRAASSSDGGGRHAHFAASPRVERSNSEQEGSPAMPRRGDLKNEVEEDLPESGACISVEKGILPTILHGIAPAIMPRLKASIPDCEIFAHNWVVGEASSPFLLVGHNGTDIMTQGLLFHSRDRIHKIESVFYTHLGIQMPLHVLAEMAEERKESVSDCLDPARFDFGGYESVYYEVTLKTSGMFQIGWASNSSRPSAIVGDGVGDTSDSWAYDGCRRRRWHDAIPGVLSCGNTSRWAAGDVVGCLLQVPVRVTEKTKATGARLEFFLNGVVQHIDEHIVPFEYDLIMEKNVRDGEPQPDWQLYPALSLENLQECHVNVGQEPFSYPPPITGLAPAGRMPIEHNEILSALNYFPPMQSTPLAWALSRQNTRAVAVLLECDLELVGASVLTGWSAFEMAAFFKHSSGLRMLIDEAVKNLPRQPRPIKRQRGVAATRNRGGMFSRRRVRRNDSGNGAVEDKLKASLNRALVIAAGQGSLACAMLLLRPSSPALAADVHHKERGWSALHCAALNGHAKIVSYLLDSASADVQSPNMHGSTPIHLAAFRGHESVLRVLLRHIHECLTPGEQTPLTVSGARRDAEAAKMVMTTVVDSKDGAKVTAVTLALKRNALGCVKLLLDENPVRLNLDRLRSTTSPAASSSAATALGILGAAASPDVSALQIMMGVTFECGDENTLAYVMDVFDMDLEDLLSYDCLSLAPNEDLLHDVLTLFYSEDRQNGVKYGSAESLVSRLVQFQKPREYCMLDVAILYLSDRSSKLLISYGADVNSCVVFTPLVCSVLSGSKYMAELLLHNGAAIAGLDIHQSTALTRAVHQGKPHLISLLLEWGASESEASRERDFYPPAMHYALRVTRQHHNCLAILVQHCPEQINNNTREHRTPLYKAVKNGATDAAIFLLKHGADANLCNVRSGGSPLHHAAHRGNLRLMKALLDANAVADVADVGGVTPLHYGVLPRSGLLSTVQLLLDALKYQLEFPSTSAPSRSLADAINSPSINGKRTALHWLCTNLSAPSKERKACLQLLLDNGADVSLVDSDGSSPWHWACTYHNSLAFELYNLSDDTFEKKMRSMQPALGGEVVIIGKDSETVSSWFSSPEELVHQYPPLDARLVATQKRKPASSECFTSPPRLIRALSRQHIAQVSCGEGHFAARTIDGSVFMWGAGAAGQLGLGYQRFQRIPVKLDAQKFGGDPVRDIACGSSHTLAVASSGAVYAFGSGSSGQLGCGDWNDQAFPRIVPQLSKRGVIQVAAGSTFSAALTKDTSVYYWGTMVGSDEVKVNLARLVAELRDVNVVYLAAGRDHLLAVDTKGQLHAGGRFSSGQLGQGENSNGRIQLISSLSGLAVFAAGGAAHSAAVTSDGRVHTWGSNRYGQLGLLDAPCKVEKPSIVSLDGMAISVACSERATAVCTVDGRLLVASRPCGTEPRHSVAVISSGGLCGLDTPGHHPNERTEVDREFEGELLEESAPADSSQIAGDRDASNPAGSSVSVTNGFTPAAVFESSDEVALVGGEIDSVVSDVTFPDSSDSEDFYSGEEDSDDESEDESYLTRRWIAPSVAFPPQEAAASQESETQLHTVVDQSVFAVDMGSDVMLSLLDISLDKRHTCEMFLGKEDYSDVIVRFSDGQELSSHKAILAARSSVFRDVLLRKETSTVYVTLVSDDVLLVADEMSLVYPLIAWAYTDSLLAATGELLIETDQLLLVAETLSMDLKRSLLDDTGRSYLADLQPFADVFLRASDKEAPLFAHKVLLAARSEYFNAMFSLSMLEGAADTIDLPSIAHSVLAAVLQFVYSGTFEFSSSNILGLLAAADQLNLLDMKCDVEAVIVDAVDKDNVVALHGLALQHGAFSLKLQCERFMEKLCKEAATDVGIEVPQDGSDEFHRQVALLRKLTKIRGSCQP